MHNRRLVLAVVAALVIGFGATATLTSAYRELRDDRIERHLARGRALTAARQLPAAAREYSAALHLGPRNLQAGRALVATLLALDRHAEAEATCVSCSRPCRPMAR